MRPKKPLSEKKTRHITVTEGTYNQIKHIKFVEGCPDYGSVIALLIKSSSLGANRNG